MRARKRFGQNFLTDQYTIGRIVDAINPLPAQHIVEIGPGHGALTASLSKSGCKLDVIEIDRDLASELKSRYQDINVIEADVLKFDFTSLESEEKIRVVGNLPYNISTPLLFRLFRHSDRIQDMHFMLQLEVVNRMVAAPSTPDYGRLSVMCQYYCDAEKLFSVDAGAFTPKPKVMSAIVRLVPKANAPRTEALTILESMVSQAFSQRRKTIRNGLKNFMTAGELESLGISPALRPENLSLEDYVNCANFVHARPE